MKQNIQDDIKQRLLEVRKEYGTTFAFIAKELNIHRAMISMFVAGSRGLSLTNEIKLRKYLNETFPKKED